MENNCVSVHIVHTINHTYHLRIIWDSTVKPALMANGHPFPMVTPFQWPLPAGLAESH